jgi:hypothetical protein
MSPDAPKSTLVVRLPWYRESAFRAWIKNSLSTIGVAFGVVAADWASWKTALISAGVLIAKDLIGSAWDIWFASPDVFQKPPVE